jgi:hypothetical protein
VLELFVSCPCYLSIYLLSLDLAAIVFTVAPSTELISCYFNICSAFILLRTIST